MELAGVNAPVDVCAPESFVKKAAAMRAKYHLPDFTGKSEWTITPDAVASHPSNRNGVRMNGQRCEELFLQVFRKFDYAEACHGAVCIDKRDDRSALVRFHSSQIGDPHIACLPVDTLRFASLGSSHINQVLRNAVGGAVVRSCPDATDAAACLSLALITPRDSALAEACRVGLRWEVLASKLEEEQPDGVLCIQAALNDPAHAAMLVHEMQIVKQLADVCTKESDVAGEVRLETIRAQLMSEGLPCASSNSFLPLLQFVVEQGGNRQHGFVQPLVEFHQLFVNPRVRRLRETHFRVVCSLPSPRLRLALLKAAYGCPVSGLRDGWIDYFGSQHVTKIMTKHAKAFALADKLAARFHVDYASAGAWKDDGSVRLLHALDIEFGRILLCKEGYQGTAEEIAATAGVFDARLREALPAALAAKLGHPLPVAAVPRGKSSKRVELNPTLAEFTVDGNLVPKQIVEEEVESSVIAWSHDLNGCGAAAAVHSRVLMALSILASEVALPGGSDLETTQANKITSVRALCHFAGGTLILLPQVPSINQIASECSHPHRVAVSVGAHKCYLLPCWKPAWPHPFWASRRMRDMDLCNAVLLPIKDSVVHSIAIPAQAHPTSQRYVTTETVCLPMLVNVKDISAGEEIILHVPQEEALAEQHPERGVRKSNRNKGGKRERTWLDKLKRPDSSQRRRTSDGE